ncbi:hypothetical protein QM996_27480 (plasmid) [Sinorhizobium chiapasense]|uniref:hypothetical protein n=1 Tax=Sinorhizobium chiapasense TaxID=501572 RepID=UPI002FDF91D3
MVLGEERGHLVDESRIDIRRNSIRAFLPSRLILARARPPASTNVSGLSISDFGLRDR